MRRPPELLVALGLGALEVVLVVVAAVGMALARPAAGTGDSFGFGVGVGVVMLLFAGLLLLGLRALWRGYRWGRGPVITWQVLQAVVVFTERDLVPFGLSWLAFLVAGLVLIGVLAPRSLAATDKAMGGGVAL